MTEDDYRAAIVAEACTWLRTPYRHLADVKGLGVDCAMLLVRVFQVAVPHRVTPDFDPRPYSPEWYLHQQEELYMLGLEKFGHCVESGKPGDVLLYRFGKVAGHAAIIVDGNLMIHAHQKHGNVELAERRTYEDRLISAWSVFA
jgi:NlpC/P60 family putative phage cell wall peptidase